MDPELWFNKLHPAFALDVGQVYRRRPGPHRPGRLDPLDAPGSAAARGVVRGGPGGGRGGATGRAATVADRQPGGPWGAWRCASQQL